MPKENETNRREVLKLAGASLASLSGINVVSAKQKTDAPSVNPNDQSTITEFIRYMVTLSYEEQKQAVNSLRDSERDAVLEALSDIRLETETTITRVEEQNDISAQAGRLEFAKNMVYGITKNGGQRAWAFKHTVSYRVNNGSIVRGSQTANQDGWQKVYPWSYRGVHNRSGYFSSDGYNSREVGLFRYCPTDIVDFCIKENDHATWSNISAFPNGYASKRGGTFKL